MTCTCTCTCTCKHDSDSDSHNYVVYLELAGEHAARVDVVGVGFDGLVVTEDLRRRRGGHGRQQQAVAHAVLRDVRAQPRPVVALGVSHAPHVVLKDLYQHNTNYGVLHNDVHRRVQSGPAVSVLRYIFKHKVVIFELVVYSGSKPLQQKPCNEPGTLMHLYNPT